MRFTVNFNYASLFENDPDHLRISAGARFLKRLYDAVLHSDLCVIYLAFYTDITFIKS